VLGGGTMARDMSKVTASPVGSREVSFRLSPGLYLGGSPGGAWGIPRGVPPGVPPGFSVGTPPGPYLSLPFLELKDLVELFLHLRLGDAEHTDR
jgi:hypothetical protein